MVKPKPFTLKCPNCGWSKCIYPKSDTYDISWGIKYTHCPKCGTPTERVTEVGLLCSVADALKYLFNK